MSRFTGPMYCLVLSLGAFALGVGAVAFLEKPWRDVVAASATAVIALTLAMALTRIASLLRSEERQASGLLSPRGVELKLVDDAAGHAVDTDIEGEPSPEPPPIALPLDPEAIALERLERSEAYSAEWLRIYHDRTGARAGQSFWASLFVAATGFGVIIWVIARLIAAPPETIEGLVALGGLGAISAAMSGYVVKTFMRVHEISVRQLNRFFDHPARMSSLLAAWRMAQTLPPDDPARPAAIQTVITEMSTALMGDPASTDPDAPPDQ